ncbi:MAG: zinc-binding dehydrogenase [Clostridiales bacterium]|nr:zinc-binding dehydrogenase [Clostridiales bacterium]
MINYVYRLVSPQFISIDYSNINVSNNAIVRPLYMSICHADQRYFLGARNSDILSEKLPMALIHECCGEVVADRSGTFKRGQKVVLIPNIPAKPSDYILENYDECSHFASSNCDGFMREFVDIPADRLLPYDKIPPQNAVLSEYLSVAVHSVTRLSKYAHECRDNIAVWGDGSLAYVVCCALRELMPKAKITVIGKNLRKLSRFSFAHKTYLNNSLPKNFHFDHAFECVGGEFSGEAIEDIIKHIKPQGTVMLMGVSENKIPVNTRQLLEKGLMLIGSSRSGKEDFATALNLMQSVRVRRRLGSIVYEDAPVRCLDDIYRVFSTDLNTPFKTIFEWKL